MIRRCSNSLYGTSQSGYSPRTNECYQRGKWLILACWGFILTSGLMPEVGAQAYQVASDEQAQERLDQAMPGDTILVEDGEYANFNVTINQSGTADRPIVFRAQTGGKVQYSGQSGIVVAARYAVIDGFVFNEVSKMSEAVGEVVLLDSAQYSEVRNCTFLACGHDKWVHIISMTNGSAHNQVHHNYLENIVGQGIGIDGGAGNTDNHIYRNHINGTREDGEFNGQEPIQVGQGKQHYENDQRTIVEYNLIENMRGDADRELISNKSKGNVFRYNTFVGNEPDKELVLRGGNDCLVEGNYLDRGSIRAYGAGHTIRGNYLQNNILGIRLLGGDGDKYAETHNCLIEDNLIVNSMEQGIRIGDRPAFIHDIIVRNNRIKTHNGIMYYQDQDDLKNIRWVNNVGDGRATLATSNVPSGVRSGEINTDGAPQPLSHHEVGPRWRLPLAKSPSP